jgi:sentrin-specific protease 7
VLVFLKDRANSVVITAGDVATLLPGSYLNDTIIEFYLRYIETALLPEERRGEYLFFNPFFFKKLAITENKLEPLLRWTRGVDVFARKYFVIPINEGEHWTLAIVCLADNVFPGVPQCILFFNSLGQRSTGQLSRKIRAWLNFLWKQTQSSAATSPLPSQTPPGIAELQADCALEEGDVEETSSGARFHCRSLRTISLKLP